ncbi:MAG: hypothetical protein AAF843_08655 [Bacteroidota bacterium]
MAYNATGIYVIFVFILAGLTITNHTIYRAGLTFQSIFPKIFTMIAELLAATAALFSAFVMKLLGL